MKRFLLPLLIACHCASAPAAQEPVDAETRQRLLAGEIVLLDTRTDQAGGSARVQALFHTPAESVWAVIVSCEQAFVFLEGLETCEVLEETGDRALVHQVVKKGWPVPTQDFVFESLREPYRLMRFHLVEGNLKAMEGEWHFTEVPKGLLVDYRIRVQPGIPAPKFMVRRNVRRGMPDLMACIRALSGGSASAEQEKKDRERCPGG